MTVDLERVRTELVTLRERALGAARDVLEGDEGDGELSSAAGDQHIADHATDMLGREVDESLELNAVELARKIDDALARLDQGTYGVCAGCGRRIPDARLEAVPYAVLCLSCKALEERR